jgi:hypothetical protein
MREEGMGRRDRNEVREGGRVGNEGITEQRRNGNEGGAGKDEGREIGMERRELRKMGIEMERRKG